jgi:hypothetical protein
VAALMLAGHFGADEAQRVLAGGVAALVEGALRSALGVKSVFPAG